MTIRCFSLVLSCLALCLAGCNGSSGKPPAVTETNQTVTPEKTVEPDVAETQSDPLLQAKGWIAQAKEDLAAEQATKVQETLVQLRELNALPEELQQQIAELEAGLAALTDRANEADRDAAFQQIPGFIANGQLEEAAAAIEVAAARKPTDEQREQISGFRTQIERIRGAQRKLGAWMKLIGSKNKSEFRAAQNALLDEPEAALPLLVTALKEAGDKQRTINILETLRQLRKPQATLPVLVGILQNPEHRESWSETVDILGRISDDGAGPMLLSLLTTSADAEQRALALTALTRVPDPPQGTLMTLLPKLFADGADLPATLTCVAQAIRLHEQADLTALHGFDAELPAEALQRLSELPQRLATLRAHADPELSRSAKILSVALNLIAAEPLSGIQVLNVSAEYPDSPGKMVLDGVWNSSDLAKQWYHPLGAESQIVLDLGAEKTVTGVVVWNFNQVSGAFRGWKTAEIFVSPTPTALNPVASGIVPMAPGVNDAADYSTVISVPCMTGRYVKLKAKDLWNPNTYTGLAEIQVLGF